MSSVREQIGEAMLAHIDFLKESNNGIISPNAVGGFLEKIINSAGHVPYIDYYKGDSAGVATEMHDLVNYLKTNQGKGKKNDEEEGSGISQENFHACSRELHEVVESCEKATNNVLDAADAISAAASDNAAVMDAVNKIFEACNFQDLTGQRITKVLGTLEYIEERLMKLSDIVISQEQAIASGQVDEEGHAITKRNDGSLLSGPTSSGKGTGQGDVDKMFG